ncbi:hypothetical protein K438DRAFT_1746710 [Mycena galopus ATCC 62051]|nr:hypothetical protein K438DRAFT_1746710 [Mycena galopus ATCC 62051]
MWRRCASLRKAGYDGAGGRAHLPYSVLSIWGFPGPRLLPGSQIWLQRALRGRGACARQGALYAWRLTGRPGAAPLARAVPLAALLVDSRSIATEVKALWESQQILHHFWAPGTRSPPALAPNALFPSRLHSLHGASHGRLHPNFLGCTAPGCTPPARPLLLGSLHHLSPSMAHLMGVCTPIFQTVPPLVRPLRAFSPPPPPLASSPALLLGSLHRLSPLHGASHGRLHPNFPGCTAPGTPAAYVFASPTPARLQPGPRFSDRSTILAPSMAHLMGVCTPIFQAVPPLVRPLRCTAPGTPLRAFSPPPPPFASSPAPASRIAPHISPLHGASHGRLHPNFLGCTAPSTPAACILASPTPARLQPGPRFSDRSTILAPSVVHLMGICTPIFQAVPPLPGPASRIVPLSEPPPWHISWASAPQFSNCPCVSSSRVACATSVPATTTKSPVHDRGSIPSSPIRIPDAEDGSHHDWYLTSWGLMSRNKEHLEDIRSDRATQEGVGITHDPIYYAQTFFGAAEFLPLCPGFKNAFSVQPNGRYVPNVPIYWVVDSDPILHHTVLRNAEECQGCGGASLEVGGQT